MTRKSLRPVRVSLHNPEIECADLETVENDRFQSNSRIQGSLYLDAAMAAVRLKKQDAPEAESLANKGFCESSCGSETVAIGRGEKF